MNILFVCSKNRWRSRTAETIFKSNPYHHIRSGGTDGDARIKVTEKLIRWADLIFVMEKRHKEILSEKFEMSFKAKKVVVLDIKDSFQYMDEELIETLKTSVKPYF